MPVMSYHFVQRVSDLARLAQRLDRDIQIMNDPPPIGSSESTVSTVSIQSVRLGQDEFYQEIQQLSRELQESSSQSISERDIAALKNLLHRLKDSHFSYAPNTIFVPIIQRSIGTWIRTWHMQAVAGTPEWVVRCVLDGQAIDFSKVLSKRTGTLADDCY